MKQNPDPEVEMLRLGMIHDQIVHLREQLNRLKQQESEVNTKPSGQSDTETDEDTGPVKRAEITK